jgi:hypothetical protein
MKSATQQNLENRLLESIKKNSKRENGKYTILALASFLYGEADKDVQLLTKELTSYPESEMNHCD